MKYSTWFIMFLLVASLLAGCTPLVEKPKIHPQQGGAEVKIERAVTRDLVEVPGELKAISYTPSVLESSVTNLGYGHSFRAAGPTSPPVKSTIIPNPPSRQSGDGARRTADAVTSAIDEQTGPTKVMTEECCSRDADLLISQAARLGREAQEERSLKKGRRAMKLLHQAITVAPDYRRGWETYNRGLKNLRSRFGHSLVMHDDEINRELRNCNQALGRLH